MNEHECGQIACQACVDDLAAIRTKLADAERAAADYQVQVTELDIQLQQTQADYGAMETRAERAEAALGRARELLGASVGRAGYPAMDPGQLVGEIHGFLLAAPAVPAATPGAPEQWNVEQPCLKSGPLGRCWLPLGHEGPHEPCHGATPRAGTKEPTR